MSQVSTSSADASGDLLSFREDYEKLKAEIESVPTDKLLPINVTIPAATQTVMGSIAEIRTFRARLAEELPKFDMAQFDKLEAYARASYHTNSLFLIASTPPESVPGLVEQCSNTTAILRADTEALILRGLIDANALRNLRGTNAYRDIALDLYNVVQVLRENWAKIEGKTALQLAELTKAEGLANRLTLALGAREQAPTLAGPANATRQRAFTLFMRTYGEVRRAIAYLEPDLVDEIAPTVHTPRGPSRKKSEPEETEAPPTPAASTQHKQQPVAVAAPADDDDNPYKV